MRRLCDPADARRMLNPGPVAIVTTSWRGITNAAPIAWTAPLSIWISTSHRAMRTARSRYSFFPVIAAYSKKVGMM